MTFKMNLKYRSGYTLPEIMVVMLLIVTIISLLLPIFQSSKDTAKLAVCTMNLKQIHTGIMSQALRENKGLMPPDARGWEAYAEALVESAVMICPMESSDHFKVDDSFNFIPEPPASVSEGLIESDSQVSVYREQAALELTEDISAITKPGKYGDGGQPYNYNGTLTEGMFVDSYYFSYDPKTNVNGAKGGVIHFGSGSRIEGMFCTKQQLDDSRPIFGSPGTTYPTRADDGCFGMETNADSVEMPYHRTTINTLSSWAVQKDDKACKDDFRVITSIGSGSSYGMNIEVSEHPKNDLQLLLTDAKVPWIDFRQDEAFEEEQIFNFEDTIDARHFGKVNTLTVEGSVELFEPEKIRPESTFWRS